MNTNTRAGAPNNLAVLFCMHLAVRGAAAHFSLFFSFFSFFLKLGPGFHALASWPSFCSGVNCEERSKGMRPE